VSPHTIIDGISAVTHDPWKRSGGPPSGIITHTPRRPARCPTLRRAVRARGHFPSDEAATKLLFLVLNRSEKEWIMPSRMAKAQFAVLFGERFTMAMD